MNHLTEIYVELYKRRQWDTIPVFSDKTGFYYLSKPQLKTLEYLFDDTTFYVGYGGSGMSGKTQLECFWQLFNCLAFPDTRWMLGRKELKNLKATTMQTLLKTMSFYGIKKDVDYRYNDAEGKFIFNNKSLIILRDTMYNPSDPEFTTLGGLELTGCALDESAENVIDVVNILSSRVGRWNNEKHKLSAKILEAFNPVKNHVSTRYWIPFRDKTEPSHKKFVRALSSDNPHPDARAWEENVLKTGDKRTIERLYYGNFDYDDENNALIPFDKIQDMFTNSFVEDGERYISSDVAITNDLFVNVVWSGLKIIEISAIRNVTKTVSTHENGELVNRVDFQPLIDEYERLTTKYKIPRSNIVYDADGIGHNMRTFLSGAVGLNNGSPAYDPAYFNLKTQLYYYFSELVNSDRIWIVASLTSDMRERLTEEIQAIRRSSDVGEKLKIMPKAEVKKIIGHSPDLTDAIVYRLLFLITRGK